MYYKTGIRYQQHYKHHQLHLPSFFKHHSYFLRIVSIPPHQKYDHLLRCCTPSHTAVRTILHHHFISGWQTRPRPRPCMFQANLSLPCTLRRQNDLLTRSVGTASHHRINWMRVVPSHTIARRQWSVSAAAAIRPRRFRAVGWRRPSTRRAARSSA